MTCMSFSAPRFTDEDEEHEMSLMTQEERDQVKDDIFGLNIAEESPKMIAEAKEALWTELDNMPFCEISALRRAQKECPNLVEEGVIAFLRSERFVAREAAERMKNYWAIRLDLFGEDKAFLPLTVEGALKDDMAALSLGLFQYLPIRDECGRGIVFSDRNRWDFSVCSHKSMVRAVWYIVTACLEDEVNQKKGIVHLVYPQQSALSQYDRKMDNLTMKWAWRVNPLKVTALHYCRPPRFIALVMPMYRYLIGPNLRKRMIVHDSKGGTILTSLSKYGVPAEAVPKELGGSLEFDYVTWLEERNRWIADQSKSETVAGEVATNTEKSM